LECPSATDAKGLAEDLTRTYHGRKEGHYGKHFFEWCL
jgi:hypothetical protein